MLHAICGATGTIGKRVMAEMQSHGPSIRALARKLPTAAPPDVEFAIADLSVKEGLAHALEGADNLFLLCPIGTNQLQMELNAVEAAAQAGVKRIVKLSVMGANPDSPIEFGRIHGRIEEAIQSSGCAWTFLRPNMFMQNLFWYKDALSQGYLPLPLGQAPVSHVDADNIASVAAMALLGSQHAGQIYTITGPEALTSAQAADILSQTLDKKIEYKPASSADFLAYLRSTGESEFVAEAEAGLFQYWSEGHGSQVSNDITDITGLKAISLAEFATRERLKLI